MRPEGIGQIVLYAVVLIALAYPLGIYMARIFTRDRDDVIERGMFGLFGRNSGKQQDWKSYAKTVLVFSAVCSALLYAIQRLQGHLFLNPDHLKGVAPHIALNTTASFVTNTNWQYYGGEYTMSYLTQMAGLAVQNFVSAGVGIAVLAAVVRGIARRSSNELGNFWRDLYRSIVYLLLPLSIVLAVVLIWQGVPQTFHAHATATTLQGAHQAIARGPVGSQVAIKQLGTNGGGYYNSNSSVPFENPTGLSNFLEMLVDPAHPGGVRLHVREDGRSATPWLDGVRRDVRGVRDRRRHQPPGRAARLVRAPQVRREHHDDRQSSGRQHVRQGGAFRAGGLLDLDDRDDRRVERFRQQRP